MSKTFLSPAALAVAQQKIQDLSANQVRENLLYRNTAQFNYWLETQLLERLASYDLWQVTGPVATGSLARRELSPYSDIDLIFTGEEKLVFELIQAMEQDGLKIRYRIPKNPLDWTEGVEAFDVLALLSARALVDGAEAKLNEQWQKIQAKGALHLQYLLDAIANERKQRHLRFDSMSNYLEPHIKLGPGGLRDLLQIRQLRQIFANQFSSQDQQDHFESLDCFDVFFLGLRQKIQLEGRSQRAQISAQDQVMLAKWLGYPSIKDFMKQVTYGLSMAAFYGDWILETIERNLGPASKAKEPNLNSLSGALKALQKQPGSAILQEQVMHWVDSEGPLSIDANMGKQLLKYISLPMDISFCDALFRSRILEACVPALGEVRGLVQHDQYHRFTVLGHTRMVLRETLQFFDDPNLLGSLKYIVEEMNEEDWQICLWAALYHDLGKGKEGSHSLVGKELVRADFDRYEFKASISHEVQWMVKNHLALSTAAFRRNPDDPSTWQNLFELGFDTRRLLRMALFTVIDIRGTNKEAWNPWKEQLLKVLVDQMLGREVKGIEGILKLAKEQQVEMDSAFLEGLGPELVTWLPPQVLLDDYLRLKSATEDLPALLVEVGSNLWIRFHRKKDNIGLFLYFTRLIHTLGGGVQLASINSFRKHGVYDWFKIKTRRSPGQIKKRLKVLTDHQFKPEKLKVKFKEIVLVEAKSKEFTISFRGADQPGALIGASAALNGEGLLVKWARVHTWGGQIEDVFCVRRKAGMKGQLKRLRSKLLE